MAIKESHIRATLEEYINLENSINDLASAQKEATIEYNRLLNEHKPKENAYELHKAAPIISSYCEIKDLKNRALESSRRLRDLTEKIMEYMEALGGASLLIHFDFDELDHRAGEHLFYLEDGQLRCLHKELT
jgi:hypothetical protein